MSVRIFAISWIMSIVIGGLLGLLFASSHSLEPIPTPPIRLSIPSGYSTVRLEIDHTADGHWDFQFRAEGKPDE